MNGFLWRVRVYYEDTDSGGVVYYANYLKFMERARTEWLRSVGFEQDRLLNEQGLVFAVCSVQVDYLRPGRLDDLLIVSAEVVQRRRASLTFAQEITRNGDPTALCRGRITVASLDAQAFKPRPIPSAILSHIPEGE